MAPEIAALIGAALGGALTLVAAWLNPKWKHHVEKEYSKSIVKGFVLDQIESYQRIISNLIEARGRTGIVHLTIIQQIFSEYQAFERNREHIARLDDRIVRNEIKGLFSDLNASSTMLYYIVNQQSGAPPAPGTPPADPKKLDEHFNFIWNRIMDINTKLELLRVRIS